MMARLLRLRRRYNALDSVLAGVLNGPDLPVARVLHHQPREDAVAWRPRLQIEIEIAACLPIDVDQCHVRSKHLDNDALRRPDAVLETHLVPFRVFSDNLGSSLPVEAGDIHEVDVRCRNRVEEIHVMTVPGSL